MLLDQWRQAMKEGQQQLITNINARTSLVHPAHGRSQEHLACFVPGMYMLGYAALKHDHSIPREEKEGWKDTAIKTGTFCAEQYARSKSGLGMERFDSNYHGEDDRFILRPETAESIYYLSHFTGDESWRDRSFAIAENLNKYARRKYGFTSLAGLNAGTGKSDNKQESFFFAELLKYLYLAQTTKQEFDPTRFVLTTEAHPLRRFCDAPPARQMKKTETQLRRMPRYQMEDEESTFVHSHIKPERRHQFMHLQQLQEREVQQENAHVEKYLRTHEQAKSHKPKTHHRHHHHNYRKVYTLE